MTVACTLHCFLISGKEKKTLLTKEGFCERAALSLLTDCQGQGEVNQAPKAQLTSQPANGQWWLKPWSVTGSGTNTYH